MNRAFMHKFFSEYLPGISGNYRYVAVQNSYAESVLSACESGLGKFSFIEGDTGIGKTMAYMLAISSWITSGEDSSSMRRAVISTNSRFLQNQLQNSTALANINLFNSQNGRRSVSLGVCMGRSNYVCPTRLALALGVESFALLDPTKMAGVERRLYEMALNGEGALYELEESDYPEGISAEDICVTSFQQLPNAMKEQYRTNLQSDIVVVNHALLISDLVGSRQITEVAGAETLLLLDEAEHFPALAEAILGQSLSLDAARKLVEAAGYKKLGQQLSTIFDAIVGGERRGRSVSLSRDSELHLKELCQQFLSRLGEIPRGISRARNRYGEAVASELEHCHRRVSKLSKDLAASPQTLVLSFSQDRGLPTISSITLNAGACIHAGRDNRKTIFTSATLSNLEPLEPSFISLKADMRIAQEMVLQETNHTVRNFGTLKFHLPDGMPRPLVETSVGFDLATPFCSAVINDLQSQHARNQCRTLLLCNSYADVDILARHWPRDQGDKLICHFRGVKLNELIRGMQKGQVLITPAGWEGISPESDESGPFFGHVAILRIPFAMPTENRYQGHLQSARARKGVQDPERTAKKIQLLESEIRALHKLRQCFGRPIRHVEDAAWITIYDHRFPRPWREGGNIKLVKAIPARFMGAYRAAEGRAPEDTTSLLSLL